jgi:hypothetical protein
VFDDPFYGYGGPLISLLFIPLGLLTRNRAVGPARAVWALALIGVVITLVLPQGRAALEANLGALDQTRAELSVYHWPEVELQDVLREAGGVELGSAIGHYQAARPDATSAAVIGA